MIELAHGGVLPAIVQKARVGFRSRIPIQEGKPTVDLPGKYTFLAQCLYPRMMAVIRSLETGNPPSIVHFAFDKLIYNRSRLFLTCAAETDSGRKFVPIKLPFDELKQLTEKSKGTAFGYIQGGIVIGFVPISSITKIEVAELLPVSFLRDYYLNEIFKTHTGRKRSIALWQYLVQYSFYDGVDMVAHQLLGKFNTTKRTFSYRQFREKFMCS